MTTASRTHGNIFPWSAAWAISLIVLGFLGILLPLETSFSVVLVIGSLLVISGVTHVIYAFHTYGAGRILWKLLVAILYLGVGMYLLTHPLASLPNLTFVIGYFFIIEAIMDLAAYSRPRRDGGPGWIALGAIIKVLLGVMIITHWTRGSIAIIGVLVGISLIITGASYLAMAAGQTSMSNSFYEKAG